LIFVFSVYLRFGVEMKGVVSIYAAVFVAVMMMAMPVSAFKPVVTLHGFCGTYKVYKPFIEALEQYSPGHKVFALDVDNVFKSWKNLQTIVDDTIVALDKVIAENEELFRDGFIFYGHSQGGLVSRAVLQQKKYNVVKYISVAGVQNGFFGACGEWLANNSTCQAVTDFMYSPLIQNSFSVAGFWRSPNREEYLMGNRFHTIANNEKDNAATPEFQKMQKDNFLSIKEMYFFGSPDDEILKPWYTSIFQTYDSDGKTMVPLEDQYIYQNDTFGLRTAIEEGRVHFQQVPGVHHEGWVWSQLDIVRKYIFPLFD